MLDCRIAIRKSVALVFLTLPFLSACEAYLASKRDITGGVVCDVLGRQIVDGGGRTAAPAEGLPLGAYLGSRIGREVYLVDQLKAAEALESSCDGRVTAWRNAETGQHYAVKPARTYRGPSGWCRDFTTVFEIQGQEQVIDGTACRRPDGTWTAGRTRP